MKTIFITGTDTHIGKTTVMVLMLKQLNMTGFNTFAIKPIASGCGYNINHKLENADALLLKQHVTLQSEYHHINPCAFLEPIAPHLSAAKMGISLTKKYVIQKLLSSLKQNADINLIEGAGGWLIPLNEKELYAEVISQLKIPTILVVGMRLGCLNHAILTSQKIIQMEVPLIGWIANCIDKEMLALSENIETLKQWIKAPCLGIIEYNKHESSIFDLSLINDFLF